MNCGFAESTMHQLAENTLRDEVTLRLVDGVARLSTPARNGLLLHL
jgi:hypothetical protein